jgi:UDP-N-acetylmuramate dehydrogenase
MQIENHVLLAPYTTFGIGGPARNFALARNIQEVAEAFAFAKAKDMPVFILGGGSNVLVSDAGWNGLVLKIELRGLEFEDDEPACAGRHDASKKILIAGAGESMGQRC